MSESPGDCGKGGPVVCSVCRPKILGQLEEVDASGQILGISDGGTIRKVT